MFGRELALFVSSFASMSDPLEPIHWVGRADPAHRAIPLWTSFCDADPWAPIRFGLPAEGRFVLTAINPTSHFFRSKWEGRAEPYFPSGVELWRSWSY